MLDDVLQPQRLYWIVHREVLPGHSDAPARLRAVMGHIADAVSQHPARTRQYLLECLRVYAALWLRAHAGLAAGAQDAGTFEFSDTLYIGRASPVLDPHGVARLCYELTYAPEPRMDAARLLAYTLSRGLFESTFARVAAVVAPACREERARKILRTIVQKYAPECTFKTRGDFNVHAELELNHLPAWLGAAMVENEMPYPLAVKAYPGSEVNKVVKPLLDRAITDSVEMVKWIGDSFVVTHFVTIVALIIELLASRDVVCLVNARVNRDGEKAWPLPYIVRLADGSVETGVRVGTTLHVFEPTTDALTVCLAWLHMSFVAKTAATHNLCNIVFTTDVDERNPLRKFLL
jgi:hypothetical protein